MSIVVWRPSDCAACPRLHWFLALLVPENVGDVGCGVWAWGLGMGFQCYKID